MGTWTWQRVRAAKEMDSKSIGLCPQGLESPRCRLCSWSLLSPPCNRSLQCKIFACASGQTSIEQADRVWVRGKPMVASANRPLMPLIARALSGRVQSHAIRGAGLLYMTKNRNIHESASVSWVRSSVAERLTADQQVPGSNPGVPFWKKKVSILNPVLGRSSRKPPDPLLHAYLLVDCQQLAKAAHTESRTRVTSMGGLYDAATLCVLVV